MKIRPRLNFWLKSAQALALAVAVCFTLGATEASSRTEDLGKKIMCTCGCAQLLGGCDHVGCQNRAEEFTDLTSGIAAGKSDKQIFDEFVAKYGATVLAAPTKEGFNLVAWIAPFAVFAAALLGTILLVRHWSVGKTEFAMQPASPELDALREKIRRETDGGF